MPELLANLSDAQREALQRYADLHGMTLEEAAEKALSDRITEKFVLPTNGGRVLAFQGLKRG